MTDSTSTNLSLIDESNKYLYFPGPVWYCFSSSRKRHYPLFFVRMDKKMS